MLLITKIGIIAAGETGTSEQTVSRASALYDRLCRSLDRRQESLGGASSDRWTELASLLSNLGELYSADECDLAADEAFGRAADIHYRMTTHRGRSAAELASRRARHARRVGRTDEWRSCAELAHAEQSATLGPDHPDTARTGVELAEALLQSGETESAAQLLEHCADVFARCYGRLSQEHRSVCEKLALLDQHGIPV